MVKNKDEDGYEKGKRDMKWWEDWLAGKERGQRKGRTDYVQVGGVRQRVGGCMGGVRQRVGGCMGEGRQRVGGCVGGGRQ